jgi:predicted nucleic-acid-binding Zn-ribbon protein
MSKKINFVCPKCGNNSFYTGEIRATGGFISKVLDVQNKKFTHVTCKRCKYTEFYQADSSMLGNIFDLTFSTYLHKSANKVVFSPESRPSFASRVSLREHEVLFAALKRTKRG